MHDRARAPSLRVFPSFVDDDLRVRLLARADAALVPARDVVRDATGSSVELSVAGSPLLAELTTRVAEVVGLRDAAPGLVRFRSYREGEGHPEHPDHYQVDDAALVVTAMLVLHEPARGGETTFPDARPWPVSVAPRAGQLVTWTNVDADGRDDDRAVHRGVPVLEGRKAILLWFFYLPRERWPERAEAVLTEVPPPPPGTVFSCVDDGVPEVTISLLRGACDARGILFRIVEPRRFRWSASERLPPFSMLFRPSGSRAAELVEEFLLRDEVASFYVDRDAAMFPCGSSLRLLERSGVTVPRTFPIATTDPAILADFVERLAGFPVVLKTLGGEGGVGVMRVDSMPALRSLVDHLVRGEGRVPFLSAYVPDAMHYRVIVVGERAVASYENPIVDGDFRSSPSDDPACYRADVPRELEGAAVAAVRSHRLLFGGVDLLRHPSGRVYVLELNFPCFFAQATLGGGIDVAGPMVDFLVARAVALAGQRGAERA